MGAILAVCGAGFCAMVSDGRMVEEPVQNNQPKVLTEELPKVRKVNKNILVGFAGDTLAAVQIINALDEYDTRVLTLEKTVKILHERAGQIHCQPVGVRLLVGGRGRKGDFLLVTLGSENGYLTETRSAREDAYLIEGACAHTEIAPLLQQYVMPQASAWRSLDDVAKTLDSCIAKIAGGDKSVNTTYYRELVM